MIANSIYVPVYANNKLFLGRHFPNGNAAVEYIYGPEGTWTELNKLVYSYNYYPQYATPTHPFNKTQLIFDAITVPHTCRDANGHLLFDTNGQEQEIISPVPPNSFAFCEHSGKGINIRGNPFYNCWYDDNSFAINMSMVYGKPLPSGLYPYKDFIRWSVIGGDLANYKVYNSDFIDCLALDGIYYYRIGDFNQAFSKFKKILEVSHFAYDKENQRFDYDMHDIYYFGLTAILAGSLMECQYLSESYRNEAMQHYVSLRSVILSKQVVEDGIMKGWCSGHNKTDLINTETVTSSVLGLGTGADLTFEAGKSPMDYTKTSNFFIRSHNVISAAVEGGSKAGKLCFGPEWQFLGPQGYIAEFYVRAASPKNCGCIISVVDKTNNTIIAQSKVEFREGGPGMNWTKAKIPFEISETRKLSFECFWMGGNGPEANMDLGFIRVKAK